MHDDNYDDDGWADVLAEQEALLRVHRDHCVAGAVIDAVDHGIDDPLALRQVAAQFLQGRQTTCICDTEPGFADIPHAQCVPGKQTVHAEAEGVDPSQVVITATTVAPFGDPDIWDCAHGHVYRIEVQRQARA